MIDWRPIRLVAFDVDGTLYAQRPLRIRMLASLVLEAVTRGDLRTMAALKSYRQVRERLGAAETPDFDQALLGEVAEGQGLSVEQVRALVADWMEERPLRELPGCRYPVVEQLFERIRRSGRVIGILSDYPAKAKIAALGLEADHVVSASDVGMLKPHPRGLLRLMDLAGVAPHQTVLIGDRDDRDGAAARRAGCPCLLRSRKKEAGAATFERFDDPLFDGIDCPIEVAKLADEQISLA